MKNFRRNMTTIILSILMLIIFLCFVNQLKTVLLDFEQRQIQQLNNSK